MINFHMILNCKLPSKLDDPIIYSSYIADIISVIILIISENHLGIVSQKRFGTLWKEDLVKVFGGLLMDEVLLSTNDG